MNRTNSAGANPALLARLQATLPDPNRARTNGETLSGNNQDAGTGLGEPSLATFGNAGRRVDHATFSSGSREPRRPSRPADAKGEREWLRSAGEALWAHAWLIVAAAVTGALLGYIYTERICVPLYRIQASVEVRNNKFDAHTEALAHVLESQSMVKSVIAAMPEAERAALVERARVPFLGPRDVDQALHERLEAVPIPSAQVIDIALLSPSRPAGVRFVNGLIEGLARREANEKAGNATLPDNLSKQESGTSDEIAIIDPAIPSVEPVSPSLPNNLIVFVLCGALFGIAVALFRKFAVNTFAGPGSVSEVLGVRELGAIPERKLLAAPGSEVPNGGMQMDANDESLRYLRSSLLYHPGKQQVRFLAFTSAAPGEGKTTVVANLSMSLAATGRRILIIDGDLRRPRLHKLMQVPAGPGLADLLRRDPDGPPVSLSRFVSSTAFQNLYILPPGTPGDDAPELLAGPHLYQLFRELAKSFDFILIDTPPLLACSDARNYARCVEGVVLVVRSSETQKRAALVARDMLLQDGASIIGTVLTGWRQNYPAYNYPSTTTYSKA